MKVDLITMKRSVKQEEDPPGKRACTESAAHSGGLRSRPSLVPEYLRDSEFFKSLNTEDDEEFNVPANAMKADINVETFQDASDLLETLHHWGSAASVSPIVQFAISQPLVRIKSELSAFEEHFPFLGKMFLILDETKSDELRMEAAMELGTIELVIHLDEKVEAYTIQAIGLAAAGGHVDCLAHALQSAIEQTVLDDFAVYEGAVANGKLECMVLLDQQNPLSIARYTELCDASWNTRTPTLTAIAAQHGQLECLKWLHKKGCGLRDCLEPVITGGDLPCLQYAVRKCGRNFHADIKDACDLAAKHGHFDCLKYLHEHRFPIYRRSCVLATQASSAECLEYVHQHYITPRGQLRFGHASTDPVRFLSFHPCISTSHNGDSRSGDSDSTVSSMFLSSVDSDEERYKEMEEEDKQYKKDKQDAADGEQGGEEDISEHDSDNNSENQETEEKEDLCAEPGSVGQSRMPKEVCTEAAQAGSVACLQFFHENGGEWDFLAIHAAALNNHLDCLQYACENGCPFVPLDKKEQDRHTNDTSQGSKEYMRRFKVSHGPRHLAELVAQREHWDCVQYLILHYPTLTTGLSTVLHQHGKQELLQLAVDHGCEVSLDVAVSYASAGDLDQLKFAFDHRCSRATKIPSILAGAGNLEGLKYAFRRGCSPSADVCVAAARAGHLDCLQYAREHGCKWNKEVCLVAARNNHLECVKYARAHGCPWDNRVYWTAVKKGFQDIVQYAKDNNCPQELCFD